MADGYIVRSAPLARVRTLPDECLYDDSYIDDEGERADLWDLIERDGVWGYVAERLQGGVWVHVGSCWGFVGGVPADELDVAFAAAMTEASMLPCSEGPACAA